MPLPTKEDSHWSFDFRTTPYFECDSDDSSHEQTPRSKISTLKEDDLDLSKREEAVSYKPNPFSIAKINAAYRGREKDPVHASPTSLACPSYSGPTGSTWASVTKTASNSQKTIIDGFKAQASKKRLPTKYNVIQKKFSLKRKASNIKNMPQSSTSPDSFISVATTRTMKERRPEFTASSCDPRLTSSCTSSADVFAAEKSVYFL